MKSKAIKRGIIVLAIIILLFLIIFFVYDSFKTQPINTNAMPEQNIIEDANKGFENIIDQAYNNQENNMIENNVEEPNNEEENVEEEIVQSDNEEENNQEKDPLISREEKAIELAKEAWGSASGVIFTCQGIQQDGTYVVGVYKSAGSRAEQLYIVNVDTGVVTER